MYMYHNFPKLSDRYLYVNTADGETKLKEQSDQGLHSLHFHLLFWWLFSVLKSACSDFGLITTTFENVRICW